MPLYLFLQNRYDFLAIYDGGNEEAPLIGSFTGSVLPTTNIKPSDGKLFIKFVSDSEINAQGFYLSYNTIIAGK